MSASELWFSDAKVLSSMISPLEKTCPSCGNEFLVTIAEQRFRAETGLDLPDLCSRCRAGQRAVRNSDLISIYSRTDAISNGLPIVRNGNGSPRSRGDRRGGVVKQRYHTVCANCGAETQLPFVPRGDRPVFCKDCFNARKGR